MSEPLPPTREELAKFLPTQRAIRAFERLFDRIPSDLDALVVLIESALLVSQGAKGEVSQLRRDLAQVLIDAQSKRVPNLDQILKRLDALEAQPSCRCQNLDPIIKRIEVLETLGG